MALSNGSPRGSEWHRWEPHIHAPGTLRNDQFSGWDEYLRRLESASPRIEALGITDYYNIRSYKRARELHSQGRLPDVKLLFPNVEMRLTIETERRKGINIHLLFSPSDPQHTDEIERLLGRLTFDFSGSKYECRLQDLARLGRALDPTLSSEESAIRSGANQFKVSLDALRDLFRTEKWLRENCLVAVAGAEQDGTAGLQADASFAATRSEIERFASIIFSGQPTTRDFWLGRKPGISRTFIESKYGYVKPCLHGCDAHRDEQVGLPEKDRRCWIKADLTFEGLRQAVIEPEERVHVGPVAPGNPAAFNILRSVGVSGAPWLKGGAVPLNAGLVTIIGPRGSGKTALADIIACGARALSTDSDASFIHRACHPVDLLAGAVVEEAWSDGTQTEEALKESDPIFGDDVPPRVRYLSQQFVERLCSKDGLGEELIREIESVIFSATDDVDRYGAVNFTQLKNSRLGPLRQERQLHAAAIADASRQIAEEDLLKDSLAAELKKATAISDKVAAASRELGAILPSGSEERAKRYAELEAIRVEAEAAIQGLKVQQQRLRELAEEAKRFRSKEAPQRLADLRQRYAAARLTDQEWSLFEIRFAGDVELAIAQAAARVDSSLEGRMRAAPLPPGAALDSSSPLPAIRIACDEAKQAVGIDALKEKRFRDLKAQVAGWEAERKALDAHIAHIRLSGDRRGKLAQARGESYVALFEVISREHSVLEELYGPLVQRLAGAGMASKLGFSVARRVDLDSWVRRGEELIDLRSAGALRGRGRLKAAAEQILLEAWRTGTAADVASARTAFVERHGKDLVDGRPAMSSPAELLEWRRNISEWVFSADHVALQYSLSYDGVDVQQLSPGTRGIVLLTLYLAIDEWDRRPLVVDQPEENLDPKSVFAELVPFFREARKRRQIILVTHNANLVVNTDADQVIVASSTRSRPEGLPEISYFCGALESRPIRDAVCELLEGGEKAFMERERRYRLRLGEGAA